MAPCDPHESLIRVCVLLQQAGSQAPLQHIHAELAEIKSRNEAQQTRMEDILSQRLTLEQQTKQVREQKHPSHSVVAVSFTSARGAAGAYTGHGGHTRAGSTSISTLSQPAA